MININNNLYYLRHVIKFVFFPQLNTQYNPNNLQDLITWYHVNRDILEQYPYIYTYMNNFNIMKKHISKEDNNCSYTVLTYLYNKYAHMKILPLYNDKNNMIICCLSKYNYNDYIQSMKYITEITEYIDSILILQDLC